MIKNSEKAQSIGIFCSPFSLDLSRIQFKYFSFFGSLSFYFRSFCEMLLSSLLQYYFCFVKVKSLTCFLFLQDWLLLKRWWKVWLLVSCDSFFDDSVFMGIGFCNWSWIHQILLFLQILNLFQVKFCLKLMFYCFNIA
jgi:hypothetical protein